MNVLKSILLWAFIALTLILFYLPALLVWTVCRPFDRRQVVFHRLTAYWAYLYALAMPGWKIRIEGREHIKKDRVYIIISNHQSASDIAVLFGLFRHYKWVSKPSNFKVPVVGWVMRMNQYIEIGSGTANVRRMLEDSHRALEQGNSLLIFPEGTRSVDLKLGSFRDGAFLLALENKVPLLPVLLDGTGRALPKNGFLFAGRHLIRVRALEEIPYESFAGKTVRELREEMHAFYRERLREFQAEVYD